MPTSAAESDSPNAALQVTGVTAGYGDIMVIHDVSLSARAGGVTAIIGPNGAGKSTALKAIVGEINVPHGVVKVGPDVISGRRSDEVVRKGIGYVPQINDVFTKLTVQENLEVGGHRQAKELVRDRMDEVFGMFPQLGTMRTRRAGNLSGGERKMLAIGRALMAGPGVILLDEPTANLSPKLASTLLREQVERLSAHGIAVLIVEQRAVEVLGVADYAYLMIAGRVALDSAASSMLAREDIGALFLGRASSSKTSSGS